MNLKQKQKKKKKIKEAKPIPSLKNNNYNCSVSPFPTEASNMFQSTTAKLVHLVRNQMKLDFYQF